MPCLLGRGTSEYLFKFPLQMLRIFFFKHIFANGLKISGEHSMTLCLFCKQEDIVVKLIDFMLVPHATTSELLAEKEQVCISAALSTIIFLNVTTYLSYGMIFSRAKAKNVRGQARKAHRPLGLHLQKARLRYLPFPYKSK